MEKSKD